jgi:2-aminoethylphosphonate-pyruvate transaminase
MLRDWGSRDAAFIELVKDVRQRLVAIAGADSADYTAVPIQGSGTFGVESVLSSVVPPDGKLLVVANGAYGKRLAQIAKAQKIAHEVLEYPEENRVSPDDVARRLSADPQLSTVAVVHCETTTGLFNPVEAIGEVVHKAGKRYVVDAMSSFGAVPLNVPAAHIDYIVSSANKCIEGVPGFSFAVCRLSALAETQHWARSLCLDLFAQWKGLESTGQFRFTPPTHALLAFHQALLELEAEGGVAGRAKRYQENYRTLVRGMRELGFIEFLPPDDQGYIITSFRSPTHPRYDFETFYRLLSDRGYVIYPGKVSNADCFRVGNIGRIFRSDVADLLGAIRSVLAEMNIDLNAAKA